MIGDWCKEEVENQKLKVESGSRETLVRHLFGGSGHLTAGKFRGDEKDEIGMAVGVAALGERDLCRPNDTGSKREGAG